MPDDAKPEEPKAGDSPPAIEPSEIASIAANDEPPALLPPKTKAPVSFNQQNNFYQQIPTTAWDRLSADQVVELSRLVLKMADDQDERHFQIAKDKLSRLEGQNKRNLFIGSMVVLVGFILTAYLALHSHEMVALTISLPLATILAMLVGNRVLK